MMQESRLQIPGLASPLAEQTLNARAWISVEVSRDLELELGEVSFITGFEGIPAYCGRLVDGDALSAFPSACYEVFEPVCTPARRALRLREAHSRVALHTWGDAGYTLASGCTRATLQDHDRLLQLRRGDVLLFEQLRGSASGSAADADPARRHAVRLSSVEAIVDPADGCELLAVEWHAADRLPFALPVSRRIGKQVVKDMCIVRANVVLVDHGRTVREVLLIHEDCGSDGRLRLALSGSPLALAGGSALDGPAAAAFVRRPQHAGPEVSCVAVAPDDDLESPPVSAWQARPGLEASGPDERHFSVELSPAGCAQLLFGDGLHGARPPPGTAFIARYRVGRGAAGRLERDAIAYMVVRGPRLADVVAAPRNPLPARRGLLRIGPECSVALGAAGGGILDFIFGS